MTVATDGEEYPGDREHREHFLALLGSGTAPTIYAGVDAVRELLCIYGIQLVDIEPRYVIVEVVVEVIFSCVVFRRRGGIGT
jgi:hypothetical protein